MRRGKRPYTYTGKIAVTPAGEPPALRIRITGRVAGFADRQPVHCRMRQADRPPVCAVAVEFGQVILENAATGTVLAQWGG